MRFKNYIKYVFFMYVLSSSAFAGEECVFSDDSISYEKFSNSNLVETYIWNKENRELKGVLGSGVLASINYWACDHYGVQAFFIFGPNLDILSASPKETILKLSKLMLDNEEFEVIKQYAQANVVEYFDGKIHRIISDEYSEFYFNYRVSGDLLILEIKVYRD